MDSEEVKAKTLIRVAEALESIASVLRGIESTLDAMLAEQREGK